MASCRRPSSRQTKTKKLRSAIRREVEEELKDHVTRKTLEAGNKVAEAQRRLDKKDQEIKELVAKMEKRELEFRHENVKLRMQVSLHFLGWGCEDACI